MTTTRRARLSVVTVVAVLASLFGAVPPTLAAVAPVGSSSSGSPSPRSSITITRPKGFAAGQVMVASVVVDDAGLPPDTDPPDVTIASGPPQTVATSTATFVFSADEPAGFSCRRQRLQRRHGHGVHELLRAHLGSLQGPDDAGAGEPRIPG